MQEGHREKVSWSQDSLKTRSRPGAVAHTCNPSTLGGQGRKISSAQEFKTSLGKTVSIKNTKISQVWWYAPVVPATVEAEVGGLLELGRLRLPKDFLDMTPKAQATKAKIDKWDYIKLKCFWVANKTINRVK
ncbi:retrotransposable element ORF2 protein, partial [Plecturocebus cupreus]